MAKIVITEKGRDRLYEIIEDAVVVGGSRECNLQIRDPKVRGLHCQIKRSPQGWKLIDLESKTGTLVNGKQVNQHRLQNGDRIQIGDVVLTFQDVARPEVPAVSTRERLERERSKKSGLPAPAIAGIVIGGALVLVLLLALAFKSAGTTLPDLKIIQEVDRLYDKEQYDAAEAKLKELDKLPELSELGKKEKADFAKRLADHRKIAEKAVGYEKAMAEADSIIAAYNAVPAKHNQPKIEEIRRRIEAFKEQFKDFPQTFDRIEPLLPLLDKKMHPKPGQEESEDE